MAEKKEILKITLLYSVRDRPVVQQLVALLKENNCEVFTFEDYAKSLNSSYLLIDSALDKFLKYTFSKSDVYMPLITENQIKSMATNNEMSYALSLAKNKGINVVPICIDDPSIMKDVSYMFMGFFPAIFETQGSNLSFLEMIEKLRKEVFIYKLPNLIDDYRAIGDNKTTCKYVCELISKYGELLTAEYSDDKLITTFQAIYKYVYKYSLDWSYPNAKFDRYIVEIYQVFKKCLDLYLDKDVNYSPEYVLKLINVFNSIMNEYVYLEYDVNRSSDEDANYQIKLIEKYPELKDKVDSLVDKDYTYLKIKNKEEKNEDNKIQVAIAEYLLKSNELFNLLREKVEQPLDFYQCLKMSYERLKNYCALIKDSKTGALAIEKIHELDEIIKDSDLINKETKSVKEFKAVLGLKSEDVGQYDVFLSHKSLDTDMASNVYKFLKGNMLNVFFDKECLPDLGQAEYHEVIMNALDNSTHFIIVLSSLEYIKNGWVKEEMETFASEVREGRKEGNFLFLVTDEIMDEIRITNKKCIPLQFRKFEVMLISEYKEKILPYLR